MQVQKVSLMVFVFFSILNYDNYNHTKGFVRERGFERDAFGESVEKGNANELYKKNGWKLKY